MQCDDENERDQTLHQQQVEREIRPNWSKQTSFIKPDEIDQRFMEGKTQCSSIFPLSNFTMLSTYTNTHSIVIAPEHHSCGNLSIVDNGSAKK